MKKLTFWLGIVAVATAALAIVVPALSQNPQTQTAPIYSVNSKYANGTAPGYWPTQQAVGSQPAASGLNINVGPGTANCGAGLFVEYAGGTKALTANTTNYLYIDTTSSCAVSVKTSAFVGTDFAIAKVITGSSTITTIDDVRTFVGSSGGSGIVSGLPQQWIDPTQSPYFASHLTVDKCTSTNGSNSLSCNSASDWVPNQGGIFIAPIQLTVGSSIPLSGTVCDHVTVSGTTLTMLNSGGGACNANFSSTAVAAWHTYTVKGFGIASGNSLTLATTDTTFGNGMGIKVIGAGAAGADLVCPKITISGTTVTMFQSDGVTACNIGTTITSGSPAQVWHDDTLAFQNAVAIPQNVHTPRGSYYISGSVDLLYSMIFEGDGPSTTFLITKDAINAVVLGGSKQILRDATIATVDTFTPTAGSLVTMCDGSTVCVDSDIHGLLLYGGYSQLQVLSHSIQHAIHHNYAQNAHGPAGYVNNPTPYGDVNWHDNQFVSCNTANCSTTNVGMQIDAADTESFVSNKFNEFKKGVYLTGNTGTVRQQRFVNDSCEKAGNNVTNDRCVDFEKLTGNVVNDNTWIGGEIGEFGATSTLVYLGAGVTNTQFQGVQLVTDSSPCIGVDNFSNTASITDNLFINCSLTVESGASDTNIKQADSVTITDNGTRTVTNDISSNAGDPNTTGSWNGVAKSFGLIVNDTTNNIQWLYLSPSSRLQLNAPITTLALSAITAGATGSGTYDFSLSTIFKGSVGSGATTASNGEFKYDSTNGNWHFWVHGADTLMIPLAAGFISGHCAQPTLTGTTWTLVDVGGACGVSGGGTAWGALTSGSSTATFVMATGGSISHSGNGTVDANVFNGVPFCSGYTPTNGQSITYTTASSPNPCYTATTASVTPGVPTTIPNLLFWFSADRNSATDGSNFWTWYDSSTSTQAIFTGAAVSNVYHTNVINSLPAVTFSTSYYAINTAVFQTGVTIFIVGTPTSTTNCALLAGAASSLEFDFCSGSSSIGWTDANVTTIGHSTTSLTASTWYQANATYNSISGAYAFRVAEATAGSGTSAQSISSPTTFFGRTTSGNNFTGKVAEFIVYNRVLTSGEITTIETYLNGKYGI